MAEVIENHSTDMVDDRYASNGKGNAGLEVC